MEENKNSLVEALTESKNRIESCLSRLADVQAELENAVVQTAETLNSLRSIVSQETDSIRIWPVMVDYLSLGLLKSSPALARMVLGGALGFLHQDRPSLKQSDAILHLNAAYGLLESEECCMVETDSLCAKHGTGCRIHEHSRACLYLLSHVYSSVCKHAEAIQTALQFIEIAGGDGVIDIYIWIASERIKGREGHHKAADAARTALELAGEQQVKGTRLKGYQIAAGAFLPRKEALELLECAVAWKEGNERGEGDIRVESLEMWKGVDLLLEIYAELRRFREAVELVQWFDPVAEKLKGDAPNAQWEEWQTKKFNMFVALGDYTKAATVHNVLLKKADGSNDMSAKTLCLWGSEFAVNGQYEDAIDVLNLCEDFLTANVETAESDAHLSTIEKVYNRLKTDDSQPLLSTVVNMYSRRGVCHYQLNNFEKALEDLENGLTIKKMFVAPDRWSSDEKGEMVTNYLYQARCHIWRGPNIEKAQALFNVAVSLVQDGSDTLKVQIGVTELLLLQLSKEYEKAAIKGREYFLMYAAWQYSMGRNMNAGWVSFLGGTDMENTLAINEQVAFDDSNQPEWKPLLWSERSHMRLFMFEKDIINSNHFDQCDAYALSIVERTVMDCSPNTAIIAYGSYRPNDSYFTVYIVTNCRNENRVVAAKYAAKRVSVRQQTTNFNKQMYTMREVEGLVTSARTIITSCPSPTLAEPAPDPKPNLALLYKILVQSVEDCLPDCIDTLLFSPQGALSAVPFTALYDDSEGQFLVEKKCVGIIPGFRALSRCFHQQALFQQECSELKMCEPFVAGNPEPMGCGQPALPGAAEEAKAVAKLFRVKPVVGRDMTKAAVLEGLTNSSLVLISTHGYMKKDDASEGTLVMQRAGDADHDCNSAPMKPEDHTPCEDDNNLSKRNRLRILLRSSGRATSDQQDLTSDETLTGSEIAALKVRAGLVILGACQSGEGTVTREGLLGLGRSVLHAGAPTAIVTLWSVKDHATMELIIDMMTEFCKGEKTVVQCLQLAMRRMIKNGRRVYEWAPLVVFGSPTLTWPLPLVK